MPCACTVADMEIMGAQLHAQVFCFFLFYFLSFFKYISPLKIPEGINLDAGVRAPKIC